MKRFTISLVMLLTLVGSVTADINIGAGQTAKCHHYFTSMTGSNNYTAFSLRYTFPEGITWDTDDNGAYLISPPEEHPDYVYSVRMQDDGSYLVVGYSSNADATFKVNDKLFYFTIRANLSARGKTMTMYCSSVFSDANGNENTFPDSQTKIIVSLFSINAGQLTGEPIVFTPDTPMALTVGVDAPKDQQWTSYQTMISLPAGLSVATDEDGNAICQLSERHDGNFSVSVRKQDDGRYLLLCHSADSKPVTGLEGPLFTLALKADSSTLDGWEVKLTDAIFSDKQGHEVWLEDYNVQIRTPKPIITIGNISREYGDANPTLTYSVSGTLDFTPVLTTTATAASPVGTYPITLQPPSGDVEEYEVVAGTLTITPAPLVIKANDATIAQGEEIPELGVSYEGWKLGETSAVLTQQPTVHCAAVLGSEPGTYPITVDGAEAENYEISYEPGTLTVTEAPRMDVTAQSFTVEYGDPLPELTFTTEGAALVGQPTLSCEAVQGSPVGTYEIVISKGSVKNYNDHYANGTLTITAAPLLIAVEGEYSRKMGEDNPTFELSYTGWKMEDDESILTKQPVVTTEANEDSEPGEYPIVVSGAEAPNYDISYHNGVLLVTDSTTLVITAESYTIEYGDALPTFAFTALGPAYTGTPAISCEAVQGSPVGTYEIVITRGSVESENEVAFVNGTLTITPAPLVIKANDATIAQGEEIPALGVSYEGWKLGETSAVLTQQPTVHCAAVLGSEPGTYPITVDGAEAENYEISYEPGTLTVTEAPRVDVTAQSITVEYGDPLPELTFTTEGAALVGQPALSCEAVQGSPVGTYDIVIEKGSVANYNDHYENGTLTITAAPLTISVEGDYSRKMGEANPAFVLNYEGWKLEDDESVLTQLPVITCEADETSEPGEYPIVVSGAEAPNYDISYQNGVLVVTDSTTLVLTAESYVIEYGEALPTFAFTALGPAYTGTPAISCEAVQGSPVGTYEIVITRGSVESENEVAFVNGTLTITPAPLVIKANDATIAQGEEIPALGVSYEGWKLGETSAVLTQQPTVHCAAVLGSEPGTYPITVDGAEAENYEISYEPGTLTVTEAPRVDVTAQSITVEYGDPLPELTFTTEGATLVGQPTLSCEAVQGSPVGTYEIVITKGSVNNYNDHYVNGTLIIVKAPLAIIANDLEMTEGEAVPELTLRYEGFKLGETEAVLTQQPVLACEVTSESEPGEYPITVSGAEAENYVISFVPGTLTVNSLHRVTLTMAAIGGGRISFGSTEVMEEIKAVEVSATQPVTLQLTAEPGWHLAWMSLSGEAYPLDQLGGSGAEHTLTLGQLETDTTVVALFNPDVIEPDSVVIALEVDGLGAVRVGAEGPFDAEEQFIKVPKGSNVLLDFLPEHEPEPQVLGKLMVDDEMVTADVKYDLYILYNVEADTTRVHAIFREDIDVFTVDGITYGVRDYDAERVTVMMPERTIPNYAGELNVPEQVVYHGITWNVKEVAKYTFFECPELLSISIPASVETAAERILKACPHLGAIEWLATTSLTATMMTNYRNPNMLFYVANAAMVPGYAQNIVIDGRAQRIELTDARGRSDFYCPKAFTASEIHYRHNYLQATKIGGKQGWDALVLPFDVEEITHEGGANIDAKGDIHPFKVLSEEDIDNGSRPFWLYHFSAEGFISAAGIEANVPYIIAMPNDPRYEAEYLIAGTVKFAATNAEVRPTREALSVEAADRAFCPTFAAIELGEPNCYLLNVGEPYNNHPEGSVFARYRRDGHPFEAYFRMADGGGVKEFISVFEAIEDGIESLTPDPSPNGEGSDYLYDLSGRQIVNSQSANRSLKPGVYILNGKKVLKY